MADTPILLTLGIEKDAETNSFCIQVLFRHDAPNIELTKSTIAWYPTAEELQFLNEAFAMIEPVSPPRAPEPLPPPEHHFSSEKDPTIRGPATEEEIYAAAAKKTLADSDHVLVQVDDKLIEEALKRRKAEPSDKVDADSIVDRLTKKRKTV